MMLRLHYNLLLIMQPTTLYQIVYSYGDVGGKRRGREERRRESYPHRGRWRNPVGPNYFLSYPVCHSILLYLFYSIPYFILYAGSQAIAQNDLVINL